MTRRNKWQSRRFLGALWSAALITYVVVFKDPSWVPLANVLASIIVAWVLGESYTKTKLPTIQGD